MKCPKCNDRTEVLQTFPGKESTKRRRRCLAPACRYAFTSHEQLPGEKPPVSPASGDILEILSRPVRVSRPGFDAEALAAAIAVDRRRAQIRREQRALNRQADWDDGFEPAPPRLDGDSLKRELGKY